MRPRPVVLVTIAASVLLARAGAQSTTRPVAWPSFRGVNASGWAPAGVSVDSLRARGFTSMPQAGIHSVTVPGVVAGWALPHEDLGRLPLADVLAPAARVAEEGFPVTELVSAESAAAAPTRQPHG